MRGSPLQGIRNRVDRLASALTSCPQNHSPIDISFVGIGEPQSIEGSEPLSHCSCGQALNYVRIIHELQP